MGMDMVVRWQRVSRSAVVELKNHDGNPAIGRLSQSKVTIFFHPPQTKTTTNHQLKSP